MTKVNRSAKSGEFVSEENAQANPDTTVQEEVETPVKVESPKADQAADEVPAANNKGAKYFYSTVAGLKFQVGNRNEKGKHDPDLLDYVAFQPVTTRINGETVRRGILVLEKDAQNKAILDRLEADHNVTEISQSKFEELRDGKQEAELR